MTLNPQQITEAIDEIQARNRAVDLNKKWETSLVRKALILITTYFLASVTMFIIEDSRPLVSAVIPTLGYFLSTLGFGCMKRIWIEKLEKNI